MANITTEARAEFSAKSKEVKAQVDALLKQEKEVVFKMRQSRDGIEYKKLELAELMLKIASLYMSINTYSLKILDTKNNDALNDARKIIYKAIIYMEEVVTNAVDCPFRDLEPTLGKIQATPIEKRFYLVRKLGLAIDLLVDAFGKNSKWEISFVELRARFAAIAKNFIDMKQAAKDYFDPSSKDYDNSVLYVRLIRKLLNKSADEYRAKYEGPSRRIDDMRQAINFLIAARRVAMVLNDSENSEEIRKKALVWKQKMEADQKDGSSK